MSNSLTPPRKSSDRRVKKILNIQSPDGYSSQKKEETIQDNGFAGGNENSGENQENNNSPGEKKE
jgi:hypothetical protein